MTEAGVFSYRVLFFERQAGKFIPPEKYPRCSLAVAANGLAAGAFVNTAVATGAAILGWLKMPFNMRWPTVI